MRASISSLVLVTIVSACAFDERGAVVEPPLPGGVDPGGATKADVTDRVRDMGPLGFEGARTGAFTEDLEFHAYAVHVRAGAVVTFDNTHKGTAAALDTTMFLYGPRGADGEDGFGTEAIAFDDDSGWSRHARIREFPFEQGGEYLLVLGTHDARGRGRYRLEARCESGQCAPVKAPERAAACEPRLLGYIRDCVDEQMMDLPAADAIAICTDGELLGPAFDDVCLADPTLAFCAMPFERFVSFMGPVCAGEAALDHPVDTLGLMELEAGLYTYNMFVEASLPAALAAVWDRADVGGVSPRWPLERAPAHVEAAIAAALTPAATVGALEGEDRTLFVAHDPVERLVLVVE